MYPQNILNIVAFLMLGAGLFIIQWSIRKWWGKESKVKKPTDKAYYTNGEILKQKVAARFKRVR